ncbi:ABC transporter ATP-binding protein [Actinomyces sp.]|uniref:ABC transporter ATP-binding protein n=1 Tax=Actinomyces sp. TaxID=29317 RepID=UPI0026DC5C1C|nr:ABC transporter ATP-binding protein [Actinomyces sp.]MDO4901715.1 ABC transporter ATP-binding protein [Actinomyces sp.]
MSTASSTPNASAAPVASPTSSPASVPEAIVQARGLKLTFGTTHALRGIDLDIATGEVLAITGPSGSGKSTLLHVLAGVLTPDAGSVHYGGRDIAALNEADRARLRLAEFGFIFQFGQLLPDLSALDNVTLPLLLAGTSRRKALERAHTQLSALDLGDHERKLPTQLSGGQAQRVAVARALATSPRILFTDEPTGSLDSLAAEQTMGALLKAARAAHSALVIVTHDARIAAYADREVIIRDGRVSLNNGLLAAARPDGEEQAR